MVYRAALIGCGKIGSEFDDHPRVEGIYSHAGAYAACAQTELIAVCDVDQDKLHRCAARANVKTCFDDYQKMLRETQPDIVSVCTPDSTHYDLLLEVTMTPGVKAILAEKPLALSTDQAREIVDAAERQGVLLAVNYTRRYSQAYSELRDYLAQGGIGRVQAVSGFYTKGIIHNGTHWFDLARFLLGEIQGVMRTGPTVEEDPDPTLSGEIEFASGARGYLHGCTFDQNVSLFEMDIVGTGGRVSIEDSGQRIRFHDLTENPQHAGFRKFVQTREVDGELGFAMLNAVEDLVSALTTGTQPLCTGHDALAALQTAIDMRDSVRTASPVR